VDLVEKRRDKRGGRSMANQNNKWLDDSMRVVRLLGATAIPQAARENGDFGISDEVTRHGEGTIAFAIGVRGALTKHEARTAARAWRKMIAKYPRADVCIKIAGYDSDPRELWHIREACLHVCRWASYADLRDIFDAARTPLDAVSVSLLAKCGAFKGVDPDTVPIAEPPGRARH
jgi:hypothetical protein